MLVDELINNPVFQAMGGTAVLGGLFYWLKSLPGRARSLITYLGFTAVDIPDRSPAFEWVSTWLAQHPYSAKARRLMAESRAGAPPAVVRAPNGQLQLVPPDGEERNFIRLTPGLGWHLLWHNRRPVFMMRSREGKEGGQRPEESFRLMVLGRHRRVLLSLLEEAQDLVDSKSKGKVEIRKGINDYWGAPAYRAKRPLETVHMSPGLKEDVLQDMQTFLGRRDWYLQRGLPWRRGYLLAGQPGCGKSTLALALAGSLDLPLCEMNLSAIMSDNAMHELLEEAPARAILLIEDVDAAFVQRDGKDAKGITFAGLLNAIDGVSAQEGRILVMTTNHPDKLDPALVRPGRVDRRVDIGPLCEPAAESLLRAFFPEAQVEPAKRFAALAAGMTPASVQGICLGAGSVEEAIASLPRQEPRAAA